jgi:hypothetical protein
LQPGIQVINVSSLEKGVYVLRVTDKESNRAISQPVSEELKKPKKKITGKWYCRFDYYPIPLSWFFIGYWILKRG